MRFVVAQSIPKAHFLFLFLTAYVVITTVLAQQNGGRWSEVKTIFESASCAGCSNSQKDGKSGVGILFEAAGGSLGADGYSLLLCDIGGSGSTVRMVNKSGIFTIAGSSTRRCSEDGNVQTACFNRPKSVVNVNGDFYVADTSNNLIRKISKDGVVSSLVVDQVTTPSYIIPYNRGGSSYDLFISDTGGSGIVFLTLTNTPVITTLVKGLQPRELQLSGRDNKMYAYTNLRDIKVMNMTKDPSGTNPTWSLGNVSCMGYISSLMLMEETNQLFYYGKLNRKYGILALPTNRSKKESEQLCPTMVKELDNTGVNSLVKINENAFYIVTSTSVRVVSNTPFEFPEPKKPVSPKLPETTPPKKEPLQPTPQTPQTPQNPPSQTPKQPSGKLPKPPHKKSSTQTDPTPLPKLLTRGTAVAAFPTASLPENDTALMHELYKWMMKDVGIAFGTEDFVAVFGPNGRNEVPGDVDVSAWKNLTTVQSLDGSITITEYKGPLGVSSENAQQSLFSSPWTWTRKFLDSLRKQKSLKHLQELCMLNCVEDCATMSHSEDECVKYPPSSPLCSDVCIAAIVSSSVLGVAGASLVGLLFAEPANALSAVLLVPPV